MEAQRLGLRMGRARLLLALRYLLWRAEATQHEASWDDGGRAAPAAGGAGREEQQQAAGRAAAPAEPAAPAGTSSAAPAEGLHASSAGDGAEPGAAAAADAGADASGCGARDGAGGSGGGAGREGSGESGGGSGGGGGGSRETRELGMHRLAQDMARILDNLALPDRRFLADAHMLHTMVCAVTREHTSVHVVVAAIWVSCSS